MKNILLIGLSFSLLFSNDLEKSLREYNVNDNHRIIKKEKDSNKKVSLKKELPYKLKYFDANPLEYTILIRTGESINELNRYADINGISDKSFIYKYSNFKINNYKLVYGNYKLKKNAIKDFKKFNKEVMFFSNYNPVIKKVALIHLEFYKFQYEHGR